MEYKEKMEFIEDFLIEPNSHSNKVIEMVTEYKNFLEEGIISQEEFDALKKQILKL